MQVCWARGFFVPVALRACCYLVFGKELFRDCSRLDDPRRRAAHVRLTR